MNNLNNYFILLILFLAIWILLILSNLFKFLKIIDLLDKFSTNTDLIFKKLKQQFIDINDYYDPDRLQQIMTDDDIHSAYIEIIKQMPKVQSLGWYNFYLIKLSYEDSVPDNLNHARSITLKLMQQRDYSIHNLKKSLNPLNTVKFIFLLPSKVLSFIGLPKLASNSFLLIMVNSLGWLIVYLLNLFSPEIKQFVIKLLSIK